MLRLTRTGTASCPPWRRTFRSPLGSGGGSRSSRRERRTRTRSPCRRRPPPASGSGRLSKGVWGVERRGTVRVRSQWRKCVLPCMLNIYLAMLCTLQGRIPAALHTGCLAGGCSRPSRRVQYPFSTAPQIVFYCYGVLLTRHFTLAQCSLHSDHSVQERWEPNIAIVPRFGFVFPHSVLCMHAIYLRSRPCTLPA